ncbi:MAG: hypothetical protein LC777_19730, partial [Actinobacteria bacterium]|nr:hypothetical protein [Actinomycetota bacterium]
MQQPVTRHPCKRTRGPQGQGKSGRLEATAGQALTSALELWCSSHYLPQTLREWTANTERAFRYLAVCSDETVVGEDAVVSTTSELPEHGRDDAVPSSRGMKRHPALIPLSRDHHDG